MKKSRGLDILAVKVVDDILFAATRNRLSTVIERIQGEYKLGTIVFGPGFIQFYGLEILPRDDYNITVNGEHKLEGLPLPRIDRMRPERPLPRVKDLVTQLNVLKTLKKKSTTVRYLQPEAKKECQVSLVVFADASRGTDHGQLGYIAGLLFGDLKENTVFHTVAWTSHKSRRPVKSIGSAEKLAAGEGIDEGKFLAEAYRKILDTDIKL
ncbi:hypothetical protein BWQ96_10233 [Gracilariopsis chorda]|nr:hypothetical protein BWQ96_10666 [Gracilariopsis chorda]PXF39709.1 hypothetical protein BWQ96_10589 [Gracilariopsis chorda]PXF40056.1 hypothetical protein BWQ96_10233 [Gracilariopsis chorda]|eukprot:PXF39635.1 hypothetical protein BWQ96_10666 [Gracilariopsis chorda]